MIKLSALLIIVFIGIFCFTSFPVSASAEETPVSKLTRYKIMSGGIERKYRIYIPESYDGRSPVPLVLNFHGSGGNPKGQFGYSDLQALSESKGFIAVMPTGKYKNRSWNAGFDPEGVDDVLFIRDLMKELLAKYKIDKKRIYSMGMSGGARITSRLGCELTDTIAAIAPVAGIQFLPDCKPNRPLPVITFHGKKDIVNTYALGKKNRVYWIIGVEDSLASWAKNNGCAAEPVEEKISEVVAKVVWQNCKAGADVVLYRIEDGGHAWPGSSTVLTANWAGKTNLDIKASDLIWDFF